MTSGRLARRLAPLIWLPPGGIAWGIFWLSSRSQPELVPGGELLPSPAVHFIEYAVLAGAIALAVRLTSRAAWAAVLLLAIATATLYGISDEWHQSFVPGRAAQIADVGVDAGGTAAGAAVMMGLIWMAKPRRRGGGGSSSS